jgi:hypothetical protein
MSFPDVSSDPVYCIAVLNKMRYTPLATDAHGGLCPMPYALCPMPARAPHVTEKGYTFSICLYFSAFFVSSTSSKKKIKNISQILNHCH